MSEETNRREFEEWATSKGYWTERHDCNDGSFYYECPNTEARWEAWQAARETLNAVKKLSEKPVTLIHNGVGIADMYSPDEFENAMKRTN